MDLRALMAAGVTIFLAELGEKTEVAVLGGVVATKKPLELFLGAMAGFMAATLLAVVIGQTLGHLLPERLRRSAGGGWFIARGGWAIRHPETGGREGFTSRMHLGWGRR